MSHDPNDLYGEGYVDSGLYPDQVSRAYDAMLTGADTNLVDGNGGIASIDTSGGGRGFLDRLNPQTIAALVAGLGPTLLGAAGIGQSLMGGADRRQTTTVTPSLPPMSALGQQAQAAALGGLNRAGSLVDEIAALQRQRQPVADWAAQGFQSRFNQAGNLADELQNALRPAIVGQLPEYLRQQGSLLSQLTPHATLGTARDQVAGLAPEAMNQAQRFMGQQAGLLDPAAQFRVDPAIMSGLGQNAAGALGGGLPALNDTLRGQIGRIYEGRMQDVNRFVDTGLTESLDRARARGYHGGNEVFREGTPGALLGPVFAEAVRQRGTLAGQQAEQELALAQALPLLGANLATQQANIGFSGNAQNRALAELLGQGTAQRLAVPALASQLEQGRLGAVGQAAGAYTTPISVLTAGGTNLVNLNQQLARSLGDFANQDMGQRLQLAQTAGGLVGGASGLADNALRSQMAGAGTSQSTQLPGTSLLDAFAPTASLLGGVGGLLTGLGNFQRPAGGMVRVNPDGTLNINGASFGGSV